MTLTDAMVFVVEDDEPLREALSSLIRSSRLQVTAFATARDFLSFARPDLPSCLVCDVRLPGLSGLELQRELVSTGENIPVIFITGHGDIPMTVQAMKAGAVEFLPKPFRDQDLLDAIWLCLQRDREARNRHDEMSLLRTRWAALTPREREVCARVVAGLLNKQVAAELGVSEITVKIHRRNALRKMAAASLAELVRMVEKLRQAE